MFTVLIWGYSLLALEPVAVPLDRDISHPDAENQNSEVLKTFAKLKVPLNGKKNILTVANKIDKIQVWKIR